MSQLDAAIKLAAELQIIDQTKVVLIDSAMRELLAETMIDQNLATMIQSAYDIVPLVEQLKAQSEKNIKLGVMLASALQCRNLCNNFLEAVQRLQN